MAYRDPYTEQYGRYDQSYTDAPDFSSYNTRQPHQAYDHGGYDSYGTGAPSEDANHGEAAVSGQSAFAPGHHKWESANEQGVFSRTTTGNQPRDLRHWRYEHHGALWTKGSRGACIGRFCCCTLMTIIFIFISILLPLALWTRPPNIIIGNVQAMSNGSEIQVLSNGVQINLELPIQVNNPNYFTASFSSIRANIYYPINKTLIGQGQENDVTFYSHTNTSFTFPFSIEYTTSMSSSAQIIADLASKCGFGGGTVSDITVDYDITLALRVLFFTVSPTISNFASFKCPLTESDLEGLVSSISGGLL